MLPHYVRCVLSRLRYNGHSLLFSSYLSRIGSTENPSFRACGHSSQDPLIPFCIFQLGILYVACFLVTFCHFTTFGPGPRELPCFWGSIVIRHAPIPREGLGSNNDNNSIRGMKQRFDYPIFQESNFCQKH